MKNSAFLGTIYLGDRAARQCIIDFDNNALLMKIDCISRVRDKYWNFYIDEDLYDGYLVFEDIAFLEFEDSTPPRNGDIGSIDVLSENDDLTVFEIRLGFLKLQSGYARTVFRIGFKTLCLQATDDPSSRIRD
ncbi:DUF6258 family protein [Hoeflea marina]|uniref:DUF6258 family protein n=1 Tax=Hoeflea marina TaxID=274592 RepID=UPI000D71760F|nr:DUF6258 family protein [Hoeflea marina]